MLKKQPIIYRILGLQTLSFHTMSRLYYFLIRKGHKQFFSGSGTNTLFSIRYSIGMFQENDIDL